jgi:hypothetical protein
VALWILVTEFGALVYFVVSVVQRDWLSAAGSISVAVAIVAWVAAVKMPTRCGVTTIRGHPCPNPTTGVLFGCGSADHTWAKPLARIGLKRSPIRRPASDARRQPSWSNAPAATHAAPMPTPATPAERERLRSTALFWLAILSTTGGLTSTTTDLIGLFR